MKPDFEIRAVEIHSLYAWDYRWVIKVMDFMKDMGMNTLILHRNDFIESVVYPGSIFGYQEQDNENTVFDVYSQCFRKIFKYTPTRRSNIFNKRAYFKRVLEEAKRRGLFVYIENKELYFPDIVTELYPHLLHDGHVCANDPFWLQFLKDKFTEFFRDFPEVAGIITSPATSESKVSIKSNRCTCDRCKNTSKEDWYRSILNTMYEVIHSFGKDFIVRDFVFDSSSQNEIATVMEELPEDVIISLKNTPHDYYPTFPINSRIGNVGKHRQWIEFDSMGQYFGMGLCVADLTEDYRRRLKDAKEKGVCGVIFRTDWESLDGHTSFDTPNKINLYSGARLTQNLDTPSSVIYQEFALKEGWIEDNNVNTEQQKEITDWLQAFYSKTWSVTSKTVFINGCVFSDSSMMPISMEHGLWLAEEKNSLKDWDPSKANVLSPKKESVEFAFKEKEEALNEINEIIEIVNNRPACVNEIKAAWIQDWMMQNHRYVNCFGVCCRLIMISRYLLESKETDESFRKQLRKQLDDEFFMLDLLIGRLEEVYYDTSYPINAIYTLLDIDRLKCLKRNILKLSTRW